MKTTRTNGQNAGQRGHDLQVQRGRWTLTVRQEVLCLLFALLAVLALTLLPAHAAAQVVLLTPADGAEIESAPSFSWSPGTYDVLLFYSAFYYDLGPWSGYIPATFWMGANGFAMPGAWWDLVGLNTPCYWAVYGYDTTTQQGEWSGVFSFTKIEIAEVVLPTIEETSVRSQFPDTTHDELELLVQNYSFANSRSYVRFDLSALPEGATVESAQVELYYCNCDGIDDIGVFPAEGPWSAATLTWNNQPGPVGQPLDVVNLGPNFYPNGDCGDVGEYVAMPGGSASKPGWFISDLVQDWIDGITPNEGVVFMGYPEYPDPVPPGRLAAAFGHSETGGNCPELPPRLRVRYRR